MLGERYAELREKLQFKES